VSCGQLKGGRKQGGGKASKSKGAFQERRKNGWGGVLDLKTKITEGKVKRSNLPLAISSDEEARGEYVV